MPFPAYRLAATTAMLNSAGGSAKDRYFFHVESKDMSPGTQYPSLLVSFFYLKGFLKHREKYIYRDWVMDSGAFSANQSGQPIDLQAYIETCKEFLESDPKLSEVFALDVIGDWKASLKNTQAMWDAGIPAIPCYHVGEPESVLLGLAKDFPKIALGGAVGYKQKDAWAKQCFARVWPKAIHGFGFGSEKSVMQLPFHSVDATNWEMGPCAFGRWAAFGRMTVRGSKQNLRAEVEHYLALERRAQDRWAKEMAKLGDVPLAIRMALSGRSLASPNQKRFEAFEAPAVRLVAASDTSAVDRQVTGFGAPSVKLALSGNIATKPGGPTLSKLEDT